MKTLTASISFLSLLCFSSLFVHNQSKASNQSQAQPTPTAKPNPETVSPKPNCSPQPSPLSEEKKNNPVREMTAEDALNASLGTRDWDCDGICNFQDNCTLVFNPDQKDADGDGKGDACNPKTVGSSYTDSRCDADGDGIADIKDNCPAVCNPKQTFVDANKNGVNDACDSAFLKYIPSRQCAKREKVSEGQPTPTPSASPAPDSRVGKGLLKPDVTGQEITAEEMLNGGLGSSDIDCDGVHNPSDNCVFVYNPNQKDRDKDGAGDSCDADLTDPDLQDFRCDFDGDGVPDLRDNCPGACNSTQKLVDVNKNGVNDLCDPAIPKAILGIQVCSKPRKVKPLKPKRVSASANR